MLNTYDQQINLVNQGLATMKNDGKYTTFKYAKKVMYDYLWNTIPETMESRGHVYDNATHALVQAAPRKSFNYLEKDWWKNVPKHTLVEMYKKINGYMACATIHNGELVVSTTGTTTSEYAVRAKKLIMNDYHLYDISIDATVSTLFEVVVPQDPHIVEERQGLHLLGWREKANGNFHPNGRPIICTLANALEYVSTDEGEGFMVYPTGGDYSNCCKLKTPHYVGKKKLMRMTAKNVDLLYNQSRTIEQQLPAIWMFAVDRIKSDFAKEDWVAMTDQQRRTYLENIE